MGAAQVISTHVESVEQSAVSAAAGIRSRIETLFSRLKTDQQRAAFALSLMDPSVRRNLARSITSQVASTLIAQGERTGIDTARGHLGPKGSNRPIRSTLSRGMRTRLAVGLQTSIQAALRNIGFQVQAIQDSVAIEGRSPSSVGVQLAADLRDGGPIFSGLTKDRTWIDTVRQTAGQAADRSSLNAAMMLTSKRPLNPEQASERAASVPTIWITVGDKRTCDPCAGRHNEVKLLAVWESIGMPRGDWGNPCTSRCRCHTFPTGMIDEAINRPIVLGSATVPK